MSKRMMVLAAIAASFVSIAASAPASAMSAKGFMKAVNGDPDKTISKEELDAYAKKKFAELEKDNDKTLNAKELHGRLSEAGMATADPDKDAAIDEQEFVGYAEKLFDEANAKGDQTLSVKELETPAGHKLIKLLE